MYNFSYDMINDHMNYFAIHYENYTLRPTMPLIQGHNLRFTVLQWMPQWNPKTKNKTI